MGVNLAEVSMEWGGRCSERAIEGTVVSQHVSREEGRVGEQHGLRADRGWGREPACKIRSFYLKVIKPPLGD